SCSARRMSEEAAYLVDMVLPQSRYRLWTFTFPWPIRRLMARDYTLIAAILNLVKRPRPGVPFQLGGDDDRVIVREKRHVRTLKRGLVRSTAPLGDVGNAGHGAETFRAHQAVDGKYSPQQLKPRQALAARLLVDRRRCAPRAPSRIGGVG
ncbi:MAG: hypothetical protein V1755_09140, partial [Chloroflexota bacterium]